MDSVVATFFFFFPVGVYQYVAQISLELGFDNETFPGEVNNNYNHCYKYIHLLLPDNLATGWKFTQWHC